MDSSRYGFLRSSATGPGRSLRPSGLSLGVALFALAALVGLPPAVAQEPDAPGFGGVELSCTAPPSSSRWLAASGAAACPLRTERSEASSIVSTSETTSTTVIDGTLSQALFRAGRRQGGEAPDQYYDTIQPIIARRCTCCHGCENSPCSLKIVSYQGLQRGGTQMANQTSLALRGYQAARLKDGPQLGTDAEWRAAWQQSRPLGQRFNPVAPEAERGGEGAEQSLLYRFLQQGNQNNRTGFDRTSVRRLEQARYDGGATVCVANSAEYEAWRRDYPEGGMPFGCPGLKRLSEGGYGAGEFDVMEAWIKRGAPGPSQEAVAARERSMSPETIARWEAFLNRPTAKGQLISRYLYEHLFRAHVHFDAAPGEFYELVRASNPPGELPVRELVTPAPNDPPQLEGGARLYYRLRKMTELITIKDHIVWEASAARLARLRQLFEDEEPRWDVAELPGYDGKNPFLYFRAIPPSLRYKFLLENARYLLDNLTRSPVCNGSKATFAMDDYVWAWFLRPEADPTAQDSGPAAFGPAQWELVNDGYRVNDAYLNGRDALAKHNERYLTELELRQRLLRPEGLKVEDLWDGGPLYRSAGSQGGKDPNAWVSALRHETNASVHFGGEGGRPVAVWLFNFTNLERAYYSLSFNYQEWGSLQHKLLTWRDFMHVRLEAEDRFLSLLDVRTRTAVRHDWSSGVLGEIGLAGFPDRSLGRESTLIDARQAVESYVWGEDAAGLVGARPGDPTLAIPPGKSPREAFLSAADQIRRRRFTEVGAAPSAVNDGTQPAAERAAPTTRGELEEVMRLATHRQGFFNSRLPSVAYVRVLPQNWVYTIVAHRRYAAHNSIGDIVWARRGQSQYDYTSIYRGVVGDYPNLFLDVPLHRAREFFERLVGVATDADWLALREEFMVQKNGDDFWRTADWYHSWLAENQPVHGGIVDLREYDTYPIPPESLGK